MKKLCLTLVALLLLSGGLVIALYYGWLRFNYPSSKDYPVKGLDISHHQGQIDWTKINPNEFQFVFIKASEGETFKDPQFLTNWQNAKARGLKVGAYHFFTFCKSGTVQAQNFINSVPQIADALPPVMDLEYFGNCRLQQSKTQLIAEIKTMESMLFKHYQKKPIFYVTAEFYNEYISGDFLDNPLWYRDIYRKPNIQDNRTWTFWQFTNRGNVDGINTFVDMNVFAGSQQDFSKL